MWPPSIRVFRGFVPAPLLRELIASVRRAYEVLDAQREAGTIHPELKSTLDWGGLGVASLKQHLGGENWLGPIIRHIEGTFPGAKIIDHECTLRRHKTNKTGLDWHIDADAAASAQFDPCFNMWLPFDSVGDRLPSLEVVDKSEMYMRSLPLQPPEQASRTDEWRRTHFPHGRIICPKLEPGDALLFSHYVLHRTQRMMHETPRMSGEFRFTAPVRRAFFDRVISGFGRS